MKKAKQTSKTKKLSLLSNRRNLLLAISFVVLFGAAGVYYLLSGHAAGSAVDLQLGYDRGICMDNYGDSGSTRNPITLWSCNKNDQAQQFTLESVGSNRFLLKDAKGTCVDDSGDSVGSSGNQVPVITWSCNKNDHAQIWMWAGSGGNHELKNAYNNGCINDPGYSKSNGTHLIVYSCSPNTSNEHWYEASANSGGNSGGSSSSSSTSSKIISAARHWNGVWYRYGAGHESYTTFHKGCPTVKNTSACEVDCSGLVSMATDMALGKNYSWYVDGGGIMRGSGSGHWHQISLSSVTPGDIVTASDHVEFVDGGKGSYPHIATFGAHSTGEHDGYQAAGHTFQYTKAFRYE